MATITPEVRRTSEGIPYVIWENAATGDTINRFALPEQWGLAGSVQISGTFGGATAKLQHSNDGTNWFDAKDLQGNDVSATAAAIFEVSISSAYFRVATSGGTGDAVDVIIVLRGLY